MSRTVISTPDAPQAIGPYSQAIATPQYVFCSGQIPIDPATGDLVAGGIVEQTHQVLKNLTALLASTGLTLQNVVKTTVFVTDLGEFAAMNEVYAQYFTSEQPARSTVQVAALPKGSRVEIEAIVLK